MDVDASGEGNVQRASGTGQERLVAVATIQTTKDESMIDLELTSDSLQEDHAALSTLHAAKQLNTSSRSVNYLDYDLVKINSKYPSNTL
jgi:hypothetical protein